MFNINNRDLSLNKQLHQKLIHITILEKYILQLFYVYLFDWLKQNKMQIKQMMFMLEEFVQVK